MKSITAITLLVLVTGSGLDTAAAGHRHHDHWGRHHVAYGKVVRVRPIYETVEVVVPETRCSESYLAEVVADPNQAALTGAVTGGLVGGIAGDQIGQGPERSVMTVAGVVAGAAIGYKAGPTVAEWFPTSEWLPGECSTVEHVETTDRLVGYRVKYRYRGHVYHTRTTEHPGDRIRVDRRERRHRF